MRNLRWVVCCHWGCLRVHWVHILRLLRRIPWLLRRVSWLRLLIVSRLRLRILTIGRRRRLGILLSIRLRSYWSNGLSIGIESLLWRLGNRWLNYRRLNYRRLSNRRLSNRRLGNRRLHYLWLLSYGLWLDYRCRLRGWCGLSSSKEVHIKKIA